MIKAEIVGHSLSPQGDELISVLATFPRIILAEVNTHRMLSKNTSSSRAIPFKKMVESVQNNPFIPIAWQKDHKGMQGVEYLDEERAGNAESNWRKAAQQTVYAARVIHANYFDDKESRVTKQLCNRLLEPFMWTTMLITGSKEGWENFFKLRNPSYSWQGKGEFKSWKDLVKSHFKEGASRDWVDGLENTSVLERLQRNKGQAEIHMMALAEEIYDAMNESTPKQLKAGEYHIPFEDKLKDPLIWKLLPEGIPQPEWAKLYWEAKVKISTAMAARTSYTVVGDEKEIDYQKMIALHDRLISQNPPHSSPMEHCARAMSEDEWYQSVKGNRFNNSELHNYNYGWCYNLKGFIPYRYFVDNGLVI